MQREGKPYHDMLPEFWAARLVYPTWRSIVVSTIFYTEKRTRGARSERLRKRSREPTVLMIRSDLESFKKCYLVRGVQS